jgi:hypothetical protein
MVFSDSDQAALILEQEKGRARFAFFPGCQSGGSDPRYVTETYRYLLRHFPDTALFLRCCGAPAIWAGDATLFEAGLREIVSQWEAMGRPVLLLTCPSCLKMFEEYAEVITCRMVYDIMIEQGDVPYTGGERLNAAIFDPCASRGYPALQKAIRALAQLGGYTLTELPHGRTEAQCCGWGGQIYSANPSYAREIVRKRIAQIELPYIVYCTNCRDVFSLEGKACLHIMDILYGINGLEKSVPTISERRINRRALKYSLIEQYGRGIPLPEDVKLLHLIIDDELARQISGNLILEEDICAVISHCEETGQKLLNSENKHLIGHLQRGIITYWVEYAPQEDGFVIFSAYCHRMMIRE